MTRAEVERLRGLLSRATPGPWEWEGRTVDADCYVHIPECASLGGTLIQLAGSYEGYQDDCDLITEAINALPALLSALEADAKDAQRYRWLRERAEHFDAGPGKQSPWAVFGHNHTDCYPISWEMLDAAVDAALLAEAGKENDGR